MWKIIFYFSQYNSTWTETYYASGNLSTSQIVSSCAAVAQARTAMNGPQCVLTAIRIGLLTAPRQTAFLNQSQYPSAGTFAFAPATDPDQDSAPNFVALRVKFFGVIGRTCIRYLAGLPEGIFGTKFTGRNVEALGLMQNALQAFVNALAGQNWSFRYTNQQNPAVCLAVTLGAQSPAEIGVSFGTQIIVGVPGLTQYILLRGFRSANTRLFGLGGVYTVDNQSPGLTAAAAPFLYYLQNTSRVSPTNIIKNGYGVKLVYAFDAFGNNSGPLLNGFTVLGASHRKRGVSALALRGRSRTKP